MHREVTGNEKRKARSRALLHERRRLWAAAVFGIFWMILAGGIGAPGLFVAFGAIFVLMAVAGAIYQFSNATRKNRFSAFDITDEQEEPDELNQYFGKNGAGYMPEKQEPAARYCPYCGEALQEDYRFCPKCGNELK